MSDIIIRTDPIEIENINLRLALAAERDRTLAALNGWTRANRMTNRALGQKYAQRLAAATRVTFGAWLAAVLVGAVRGWR